MKISYPTPIQLARFGRIGFVEGIKTTLVTTISMIAGNVIESITDSRIAGAFAAVGVACCVEELEQHASLRQKNSLFSGLKLGVVATTAYSNVGNLSWRVSPAIAGTIVGIAVAVVELAKSTFFTKSISKKQSLPLQFWNWCRSGCQ